MLSVLGRLCKYAILGILIILSVLLLRNTVSNDVTTASAYATHRPLNNTPRYLVTYADGGEVYYKNQNALTLSAINRGFDFILNYRKALLDPKFVQKNQSLFNERVGVGYWVWKPWILLDAMRQAPEDAIIAYIDGGFVLTGSLDDMAGLLEEHDGVFIEYDDQKVYGSLGAVVNKELLQATRCDTPECRAAPHLLGGFAMVKNNAESRKFLEKWLELCENKAYVMGTNIVPENQYPEYRRHIQDESLLTLTYSLMPGKFYLYPYSKLQSLYLVRRKVNDNFKTVYPHINRSRWFFFDRRFMNWEPFIWLRRHFSSYTY